MPDSARPIRFTPNRWRRWTGGVVLTAITAIFVVTIVRSSPTAWGFLVLLVPVGVLALYLIRLTSGVTVVAGREIRWSGPLLGRHRIPIDATTTITWYANVVGSGVVPIRTVRTPIGTMDNRWATIETAGQPVVRLSMRYWKQDALQRLAEALPAALHIVGETKDPVLLAEEAPRLYSPIELRPRLYQFLFVIWLVWFIATVGGVLLVVVNGFTW